MSERNVIAPMLWAYIEGSIGRLVELALELDEETRARRPEFEGANSIATLVGHTLGNAEDNLLGTLCGVRVTYDREADFEAPMTDALEIKARWSGLGARFQSELQNLTDESVLAVRSHPRRGEISGLAVLTVVARHSAEHLAHAEVTRDLLLSARQ